MTVSAAKVQWGLELPILTGLREGQSPDPTSLFQVQVKGNDFV